MSSLKELQALHGKVIVVIGGTSGIGLSAAIAFCGSGAKVVAVGLNTETTVKDAVARLGNDGRVFEADARLPETAPRAIAEAVNSLGGFHGLFHVAGGSGRKWGDGPLHEMTDAGWQATLELNLTSVMYSNRAAVRQFLQQKTPGSVVNVGSVLGEFPAARFFGTHAYSAAKAGIAGFTRSCAAYYARNNIRFNVLAPGLVATPMSRRAQEDPEISSFVRSKQPLDGGRLGTPEDLTAAAVYFMSDTSRFVTGQILCVDGGWGVTDGQIAAHS